MNCVNMKTFNLIYSSKVSILIILGFSNLSLFGEASLMCDLPCDMQCISQINLSISEESCSAKIWPSMVIPGLGVDCDNHPDILVEIFDEHDNRLEDVNGDPINEVNADHVGLNLKYSITNNIVDPFTGEECGNSCWGNVLVEYKFLPEIECRGTQILSCGALDVLPLPNLLTGSGSCLPRTFEVYIANEVKERMKCNDFYTHRIVRTYEVNDGIGNTASCNDTFLLERIKLKDLEFPGLTKIYCSELDSFKLNDEGRPIPWLRGPASQGGQLGVPYLCDSEYGETITDYVCPKTGSGTGIPFIPQSGASNITPDGDIEMVMGDVLSICSAGVFYTDIPFPQIGCTRKFVRQWEVREWWCSDELTEPGLQIIEIIDDEAPTIVCPPEFTVSTNDDCAGSVQLPPAIVTDSCGNGEIVTIEHPWGIVEGNGGEAILEVGSHHLLKYKVRDECYNKNSCETKVTVKDNTEPVAICERFTVVSISQDGNTLVSSEVFDDGSWDECGEIMSCAVRMEDQIRFRTLPADTIYQGEKYVLRSNLELDCVQKYVSGIELNGQEYLMESDLCVPYVRFCCSDAGSELMIVFRAKDHGGNFNDCMVNVEVQDKAVPSLNCPDDLTIDCRVVYDVNSLGLTFGNYQVVDNCADNTRMDTTTVVDVNQCGIGEISRRFEVLGDNLEVLRSCKQRIEIINEQPFDPNTIEWPQDFTSTCGNLGQLLPENLARPYGVPHFPVGDDECSLLGYDYEDQFFA